MDGKPTKQRRTILILGGARSGKSDYAQSLAARLSPDVLYVATATAQDDEMAKRIARHRACRPEGWSTLEVPMEVAAALRERIRGHDVVLVDCLTMLASNVLLHYEERPDLAEAALVADLEEVYTLCENTGATLIMISNEVGMGVVPAYSLGRSYRDLLGRVNQRVARRADHVLLLIAGLPVDIKTLTRELPLLFRHEE